MSEQSGLLAKAGTSCCMGYACRSCNSTTRSGGASDAPRRHPVADESDYDTPAFLRRKRILRPQEDPGECRPPETPARAADLEALDGLVLPPEAKKDLIEAVLVSTRSEKGRRRPPVLLFHGPPGTGKTHAAHLIAKAMGVPLRVVHLPEVLSKYVGEAEQRTAELFEGAGKTGHALFFDEADAFLWDRDTASRSWEVTTSNNLLTCLDSASVPVFFATNHLSMLDKALYRRVTWNVAFPIPAVAERARLWRRELQSQSLDGAGVSPEELAKAFILTGGLIRNAVERVARRLECGLVTGGALQMDLLAAAQDEAKKMDRGASRQIGFGA